MTQGRRDIPASFTIRPEAAEEETQDTTMPLDVAVKVYMAATGAVIVVIAIALVLAIGGLMHANSVNGGQAAQIRSLNQANARMSLQISQMTATLSGQNPASDTDLITCADLRRMGLTLTTGGSVSSVPGTVNLSQNPVRIPAHCAKR
jgi:uncharacterized protein HemX